MKTNPDPERERALLSAILDDDEWQVASAGFKAQALRQFRAHQRRRRLLVFAGYAAVVALIGCVALWGERWFSSAHRRLARPAPKPAPQLAGQPFLTDAQLLAFFPKGSCLIAEIDGRKELIFLDPDVKRRYLAQQPSPAP